MNMHNEPKVFHESLGFFGSWGNVDSPKIEEFMIFSKIDEPLQQTMFDLG